MRVGVVNERSLSLTGPSANDYDRRVKPFPASCALVLALAAGARAEKRWLVDEVVAVVAARSITLSEVRAEAIIALVEHRGAEAARLEPDRRLLGATLQGMVDQRLVLSEVENLRTFELDRAEVELTLLRFRNRFGPADKYEAFTRRLDMTDDEISQVLTRQLRYARYIDSKARLAGNPRKSETDERCAKELGRVPEPLELQACVRRLQVERYRKITEEVLGELRKRVDVRVLDPLGDVAAKGGAG